VPTAGGLLRIYRTLEPPLISGTVDLSMGGSVDLVVVFESIDAVCLSS